MCGVLSAPPPACRDSIPKRRGPDAQKKSYGTKDDSSCPALLVGAALGETVTLERTVTACPAPRAAIIPKRSTRYCAFKKAGPTSCGCERSV
jgi:hypothetical protein